MARFLRTAAVTAGIGATAFYGWQLAMINDATSYRLTDVAMSVLQQLDAERAHNFAILAAKHGCTPKQQAPDDAILHTHVLGLDFSNPIGLAAGFDKHAEAPAAIMAMGFGFVEVGSITPEPQDGNPKPRVFRLVEDNAVINRYGFNSHGMVEANKRLSAVDKSSLNGVLGVNLGKNKSQPNAVVDYTRGVYELGHHGHYIVINVSSPNTPGLRKLQGRDQLHALLSAVKQTRDALETQPPLLVKIAPDMTDQDLEDVVAVVKAVGFEGIIVSNTTVARPASLVSSNAQETGGLSGQPLFEPSTAVLRKVYRLTEGQIPLIGVGGVASGAAAYAKIRNGASLVQLYTAMSLQGPGVVPRIKGELAALLHQDGFDSVSQAVGVDA